MAISDVDVAAYVAMVMEQDISDAEIDTHIKETSLSSTYYDELLTLAGGTISIIR